MVVSDANFCEDWRHRIDTIDPADVDARQRLNTVYSELVGELKRIFELAIFDRPGSPLNPQRVTEACDPDTPMERLWKLITYYPAETTTNPVWSLLALAGTSLCDENGREPDEEQLVPLAQMPNLWNMAYRQLPGEHHDKLKLSYTAVLSQEQHPFYFRDKLIKELYSTPEQITSEREAQLIDQTNDLFYDDPFESTRQILSTLDLADALLPLGLTTVLARSVLIALLPVYFTGDQLLELSLEWSYAYDLNDFEACFLDAGPVADLLQGMSKTRLVKNGVHAGPFTLYPDEVYRRLAQHRNSTPQSEVAGCVHAPQDVLEELAQSTSKEIIYPLASNPMTPLPVLQKLLNWGGWGAKKASRYVHDNPIYSQGEAGQLLEMGRIVTEVDQRKRDILLAIIQVLESHREIAEALRQLLNAAVFAACDRGPSHLRFELIQQGLANHDILMATAWSWHWQDRLAVARSPHAPEAALQKLRSDGLPFIRYAASQQRSAPICR